MRSVIELILAIVATIVVLMLIGLFLPGGGKGHVERSIIIERPPSHVFDVLNSFKRFNEWSPYAKTDPNASYSFEGPDKGQGAMMSWEGNKEIGSGRFEIIESTPTSMVKMIQRVQDGYTGTSAFSIGSTDLGVKVTWTYDVELGANPIERIKGKYLDSSIGGSYQYGLMRLKALIESSAYARDYSDITITPLEMKAGPAIKMSGLVEVYSSSDFPDLNAGVADTMKKLQAVVDRNKLQITAPARIKVTLKERYRLAYDVLLPVDRTDDVQLPEGMEASETFGGDALMAEHVGERRKSNVTFEKLQAYATVHGLVFSPAQKSIEEFMPDREAPKAPDADLDTSSDVAADDPDMAAGEEGEEEEKIMVEVTRVYLPLGLPTEPVDLVDPAAEPVADPAAEPVPAGG